MAYSTSNPPALVSIAPLTGGGQTWIYRSADASSVVDTTGYITNAKTLGMRVGDLVLVTEAANLKVTSHVVAAISAAGAADLADATTIGLSSNTD